MKRPERILKAFKTRSDEAARIVDELREARGQALNRQVEILRSIETAHDTARRDRSLAGAAAGYSQRALGDAARLRGEAEKIANAEVKAREQLIDRFADQKRFEVYLSQRQLKQQMANRKREEARLLEEIDQLQAAKIRQETK